MENVKEGDFDCALAITMHAAAWGSVILITGGAAAVLIVVGLCGGALGLYARSSDLFSNELYNQNWSILLLV